MRYVKLSLWVVCVILLCVSLSEAGRFRSSGCSGGACAASVVQPLPADSEVAMRGWPWTKPPAPAPRPAPAPAPIVQPPAPAPAVEVVTSEISVEVRRPIVRAVAASVKAVAASAGAVRNREHKPVVRAVKAPVGRERKAARRGE